MQKIEIEWKHLDKAGSTCTRCAETGNTIHESIKKLKETCPLGEVEITFKETLLDENQIEESNTLSFNKTPLEDILDEIQISDNRCDSCTRLTGKKTYCRTVKAKGETYKAIPESLIRDAFCKVVHCELTHCIV